MNNKKLPLRLCIGCGAQKPKKEMVRIVKTAQDEIFLDSSGRMNGRGAYICKNGECIVRAEKTRGLERSFKIAIGRDVYKRLMQEMEGIDG